MSAEIWSSPRAARLPLLQRALETLESTAANLR
jgi:hypothetical protein